MKLFLLLLAILFSFSGVACSQSDSSPTMEGDSSEIYNATDPFEVNQSLGSSVNLGNALEAPGEGEWGMVIREEYLQLIADTGFQSVRIPVRWNAHAGETAVPDLEKKLSESDVSFYFLGAVEGNNLTIDNVVNLSIEEMTEPYETAIPNVMKE